jgi:hypothetical protein
VHMARSHVTILVDEMSVFEDTASGGIDDGLEEWCTDWLLSSEARAVVWTV